MPGRGGGSSRLAQIVWSFFLLREGVVWFVSTGVLHGYYRGIVCDFPAIHWIFFEQTYNLHLELQYSSGGKVFLGCPNFMGGITPNSDNAQISYVYAPLAHFTYCLVPVFQPFKILIEGGLWQNQIKPEKYKFKCLDIDFKEHF